MTRLNIKFLINTSIESILSNLNTIFENLLQEIKSYLNLDLKDSKIKIVYHEKNISSDNLNQDIFKVGLIKTQKNNSLSVFISRTYRKFVRMILLREAYKFFIPRGLQDNRIINIFINQKVEIDLQKSEYIEDWKDFKRKSVINYDFMEAEFDRLENFLKQESIGNKPSPFQFFFIWIRRNIQLIEDIKENIYDLIFQEYNLRYNDYNDEIIETISVITKIFYKIRSYRSLLDYQQYFKKFKDSGIIQTNLSLRKFTANMQWIKNFSNIAPSFQVNWLRLDIISILCFMKFNPLIKTSKILQVINLLPFFMMPRYTKNSFGMEIIGQFLIPKCYVKDLIFFLGKLESNGYLIEKELYIITGTGYTVNLNCFKNFASKSIILNPDKRDYNKEYEIEFSMDYGLETFNSNPSLLDWLLIDRIRYFSITGLGFERKSEMLRALKSDLLNEVISQRNLISDIKKNLNKIHNSPNLKSKFLDFINTNKDFGFFYIKQILNDYITTFDSINKVLLENPSINNYYHLQKFIKEHGISNSIEENNVLKALKKNILREFISLYFKSKKAFKEKVDEYRNFFNIFKSLYDLKIFNLNAVNSIIKDKSLINRIYESKEEKLKSSYERYKAYNITNNAIEQRLDDFLNTDPPIIQPSLLGTIAGIKRFTRYYVALILKDTPQTREGIEKLKWLFPMVIVLPMLEYKTREHYVYFELQIPNLSLKEKQLLNSILYNIFKDNIINIKSYLFSGFYEAFSRKDFYDFEKANFFYTKDLFEEFFHYIQYKLNNNIHPISESFSNISKDLWGKKTELSNFITLIEKRVSKEHIDFNLNNINKLLSYYKNLESNLLDLENFKNSKNKYFFRNYIKSIKIIPSFQHFGFGQYYLYFYPRDLKDIDFKHILHNSFQKIKFPINIDNSNSFLIKFIWPYQNPNKSVLNWLIKSKKVIREYCLFFVKKVFQIFHFNYNLSANEWDLDPNRFRIYFQNILFNPDYELIIPRMKEFKIGDINISNYFTPDSSEYIALTQLFNWKSLDIKSYLGTRNYNIINQIVELLEKKLIFPFISAKNLDLSERLYIILPKVIREDINILIKIFNFFNIGFIYEIEGEYYIQGLNEEIKFENGLMIKLYLPDCQLDEFEKLFDLIFEYLGFKHYLILSNLVNGDDFLKSIYGNLDFLKLYNPLKNLIWNNKDKIWMNHKLFTNKFEKIYPPFNIKE